MSASVTAISERGAHARRRVAAADSEPPRHALLLTVCCLAQFMVILDVAIVNVALPSIRASLGFSATDLQWIVNAYTITFAGFLMLSGRAADLFGQRQDVRRPACSCSRSPRSRAAPPAARAMLVGARAAAGPRRGDHGGRLAGDHHLVVRRRAPNATARSGCGGR